MPELPEVETVRDGLERWVSTRTITSVQVRHPRAIRRHLPGRADFQARLAARRVQRVLRRGKYLWLELDEPSLCIVAHLGMSGQLLLQAADAVEPRHLHVVFDFDDDGPQLRFVDQRTFGGLMLDTLVPVTDHPERGETVPRSISHIGRDPLDPYFDERVTRARLRSRTSEIKRVLLDQNLLSGVGNIYADESLWRARIHPQTPANVLSSVTAGRLLGHIHDVLTESLRAGGTSFDSLYVNVNGESGYFDRTLNAYGRENEPCPRCGRPLRRVAFMNRSSYFCPHCQRVPARGPVSG